MAAAIVYWSAVAQSCAVLIAAPDVMPAFKQRAAAATLEPQLLDQKGTRRAPRFKTEKIGVLVDGNPATLLELSTCGALVLSPTIVRPNQRVRMALSDDGGILRFNAAIAWAQFE